MNHFGEISFNLFEGKITPQLRAGVVLNNGLKKDNYNIIDTAKHDRNGNITEIYFVKNSGVTFRYSDPFVFGMLTPQV
ncbi:MAG: hypothetical protein V1904_00405, partial [Bacteroidota bacterium]